MSEGPIIPKPDRSMPSNAYDLNTGKPLTRREIDAELRTQKSSEPHRQVGRRFIDTTLGKIATGIGIIATAAGLGTAVKGALDGKSAEQEFSQRPVAASSMEPGKTTVESETKNPEEIPDMFVPGKTSFNLTEINIRSSAYNGNDPENYNKIDPSQIKEIEGVPFDQEVKTLIVENAKLVNGKVGNNVDSRYFVAKAKINGEVVNIYLNYDLTKEQGYVLTEADKTHESGFITKDDSLDGYHGEIPLYTESSGTYDPITHEDKKASAAETIKASEMNKVSFSATPINNPTKQ